MTRKGEVSGPRACVRTLYVIGAKAMREGYAQYRLITRRRPTTEVVWER